MKSLEALRKELQETAKKMVEPGKGLLAADESVGTLGKKFDKIKIENLISKEDLSLESNAILKVNSIPINFLASNPFKSNNQMNLMKPLSKEIFTSPKQSLFSFKDEGKKSPLFKNPSTDLQQIIMNVQEENQENLMESIYYSPIKKIENIQQKQTAHFFKQSSSPQPKKTK